MTKPESIMPLQEYTRACLTLAASQDQTSIGFATNCSFLDNHLPEEALALIVKENFPFAFQ